VLCFAAIFSIAVNTIFAIKNIGKNFPKTGGQWSHIGLGLLIIGAMASGGYSESKNLQLALGETRNAFGMEFTLAKYQEIEKELKDREKYEYHVRIVSGSDTMTAKPILYLSDFNQRQSPFLEPGIERMVFNDIYVSPLFAQNKTQLPTVSIAKDSVIDTPMGGARIRFKGFDMSAIESRPDSEKPLLGAKIEIFADTVVTDTLYATVDMRTRELTPIWTELPGDSIEVALNNFVRGRSMDDTRAVLAFHRKGEPMPEPVEILGIEVSIKPFINFVWLGSILIFAGFFVAIKRHL
jgi:cytochrome c biogenesis factor